jgi:YegS/Rv2252/BmrU family lipid kinase
MIVLLYNEYSDRGHGMKIASTISSFLSSHNLEFIGYKNDWPIYIDVSEDIWVIGGDGTFNYFINQYGIIKNKISFFRGGTGNDFHWMLYGNISLEQQLNNTLTTKPRIIDIGKCNEKYFINMVGLGFDGYVLKEFPKYKWLGGHLGYLATVIKCLFTYKAQEYIICTEDSCCKASFMLCILCNAQRTGGGFHICPPAKIDDGFLDWIQCNEIDLLRRIILLPKVEKGKHMNSKYVAHRRINQKIKFENENFIFYQLDGELMKDKIIEIEVISQALNVI